jgi:hypothetical protein
MVMEPARTYAEAAVEARRREVPLVAFVGFIEARAIEGAVVCATAPIAFRDFPAYCILVAVPDGKGGMRWKATLREGASDEEIRKAMLGVGGAG